MVYFFSIFLWLALIYGLLGLVFSLPFLMKGIGRLDENTKGASILFRILITPGIVLFWPVLLWRWMEKERQQSAKLKS